MGVGVGALAVKTLSAERKRLQDRLMKRNVGVYGAINLRTDGDKAVVAMRKEAGSASRRWFYYEMEPCLGGFKPVAKMT